MIVAMSENNSSGGGGKLVRPKNGRLVAGVCTGLAAYFKVDVNLIRLLFGVCTFLWGLGALLYVVAWAILPEEGEDASIVESFINKTKSR
jgi:phage shock protein PspC (stress-responsive transcriptional regulator)